MSRNPASIERLVVRTGMETVLLLVDSNVRCRAELRRLFSSKGFLVLTAADGLGCLGELVAMEPDVLVIALDIPWGGGDGVIARLNDGLPVGKQPLIFVIGEGPPKALAARTGVPPGNCFSKPVHQDELLDRISKELRIGRCDSGDGPNRGEKNREKRSGRRARLVDIHGAECRVTGG